MKSDFWRFARVLASGVLLFALAQAHAETLDKQTLAQIERWRSHLLNKGGAGLYQTVNKAELAKRAHLPADYEPLLKKLDKLIVVDRPERARIYRVAGQHNQWVARLDYKNNHMAFLRLTLNDQFELVDWFDEGMGVSLSALLRDAAALYRTDKNRFNRFLKALGRSPLEASAQVEQDAVLARLVVAACKDSCHSEALQRLSAKNGEISLFAVEKHLAANQPEQALTLLDQLADKLNGDPAFAWYQGALTLNVRQPEQCLDIITPAIDKWPGEARLYPLASQCYLATGDPSQAFTTLQAMEAQTHVSIDWKKLLLQPEYVPLKQWLDATGDKSLSDYSR